MILRPHDTSPAAHEAHVQWLRRIGPAARVELAARMSEELRGITRAGIASRHPEYSAGDVEAALRRLLLGDELFQRAWPRSPLLRP